MKKKEMIQLRAKKTEGLKKLVLDKKLESARPDVQNVKNLKREIAQILTIIKESEPIKK